MIGDVHARKKRLERTLDLVAERRGDLAILTGDIGRDVAVGRDPATCDRSRHDESVRHVVGRVEQRLDCPVVYVPGNHDLADPAADVPGTNADGRIVEVAGLRIAGLGGAGPAFFGFPYEWTEEEADRGLRSAFPSEVPPIDLFLSHTPPYGSRLDRTARGAHVGSSTVRAWIDRIAPKLFVCGHIHEGWGLDRVGAVLCLNAGALGVPYAQTLAWTVDWDEAPIRVEAHRRNRLGRVERRELPLS